MKTSDEELQLHFHLDREVLREERLPLWLVKEVRQQHLMTGQGRISFCGLFMQGDDLRIFLPRSVSVPVDNKSRVDLAVLMTSCIERYGRESATRVLNDDTEGQSVGSNLLSVIKELLDDYRLNGSYIRSFKSRVINSGKTDWKRTLNRVIPFPDDKGRPVYTKLQGRKTEYAAWCEVAKIHHAVIAKLDRMFGWWITGRRGGRVASDLTEDSGLLANQYYCTRILDKELQDCYADRSIRLIKNLMSWFKAESSDAKGTLTIGLREFHHAWESMLNQVLDHTSPLNKEMPEPVYFNMDGGFLPSANKKMRTDTILEKGRQLVVVDAKYYGADGMKALPGWGDMVKQFFYAKGLQLIRSDFKVSNAFVFPGTKPFVTKVKVTDPKSSRYFDDEFNPIHCCYACPVEVMKHYVARTKLTSLTNELLELNNTGLSMASA